jgi:hypothetical protein
MVSWPWQKVLKLASGTRRTTAKQQTAGPILNNLYQGIALLSRSFAVLLLSSIPTWMAIAADARQEWITVRLTVTTKLSFAHTPVEPKIDFAQLIQSSGRTGVLDPNSIQVINLATQWNCWKSRKLIKTRFRRT